MASSKAFMLLIQPHRPDYGISRVCKELAQLSSAIKVAGYIGSSHDATVISAIAVAGYRLR